MLTPGEPMSASRLPLCLAAALLLAATLPTAAADETPEDYANELANEATAYGQDILGSTLALLPSCTGNPQWLAGCQDGTTAIGCGTDPSTTYRCRLYFEGSGGDVDGAGVSAPIGVAVGAALAVPGRATATAAAIQATGPLQALAEATGWNAWAQGKAGELGALVLALKNPYQTAATRFAVGVESQSLTFLGRSLAATEAAALEALHGAAGPDYRLTVGADSGPVTVYATDKRADSDPCNPGAGLRVLGSDCRGPMFVNGTVQASVDCNAYTSILVRQPCGGYVSGDWNWNVQGTPVYPRPLQAARLSFAPGGHAIVHDALGVLHCNAPVADDNGYWLQSAYLSVSESTFNEHPLGHQDGDTVSVFGTTGSCAVSASPTGYTVTYDVVYNGVPMRASGSFAPEGPAQDLADCRGGADTRSSVWAVPCGGVIHSGGDA